jgi:ABC-type methionine transport system ATPase subunit
VLVLQRGELIEQGDVQKVLLTPRSEETRRFLDFYGL